VPLRTDIESSARFHDRVVRAIAAQENGSNRESLQRPAWPQLLPWRLIMPGLAALALAVTAITSVLRHASPSPPRLSVNIPKPRPVPSPDLDPSLSHYQMIATQSLDQLDELMTRQGDRNPLPQPVYTAMSWEVLERAE
jgi:hypothetical protein